MLSQVSLRVEPILTFLLVMLRTLICWFNCMFLILYLYCWLFPPFIKFIISSESTSRCCSTFYASQVQNWSSLNTTSRLIKIILVIGLYNVYPLDRSLTQKNAFFSFCYQDFFTSYLKYGICNPPKNL